LAGVDATEAHGVGRRPRLPRHLASPCIRPTDPKVAGRLRDQVCCLADPHACICACARPHSVCAHAGTSVRISACVGLSLPPYRLASLARTDAGVFPVRNGRSVIGGHQSVLDGSYSTLKFSDHSPCD
ncbi:unnamed protein product, partial [Protopolystoma xenopodis]